MLNETLFSELVEASRDLPGNRWAVGGNAPVMAGRMATEGCDVLLGGSFSPDFTDVLSQHITGMQTHQRPPENLFMHLSTSHTPSFQHHLSRLYFLYSLYTLPSLFYLVAGEIVEEPDIHLILEYPSGASWGHYTSRRANRYVAVNWQNTYIW